MLLFPLSFLSKPDAKILVGKKRVQCPLPTVLPTHQPSSALVSKPRLLHTQYLPTRLTWEEHWHCWFTAGIPPVPDAYVGLRAGGWLGRAWGEVLASTALATEGPGAVPRVWGHEDAALLCSSWRKGKPRKGIFLRKSDFPGQKRSVLHQQSKHLTNSNLTE